MTYVGRQIPYVHPKYCKDKLCVFFNTVLSYVPVEIIHDSEKNMKKNTSYIFFFLIPMSENILPVKIIDATVPYQKHIWFHICLSL